MFSPLLVFCSTAVPLKNKFASIYGSAGFESFRCNGVRGVDECGYLCWRHWDAGQGSIRLAEPSHPCGQYAAAPLTLVHITLHLHNSTQSSRSGRPRLFLFQFVQHETKAAHDSSADWPDAQLHISTCSNSWWFVCRYSSYFPNSVFTPTLRFNTSSAGCVFPLCCGWW